MPEERDVTLPWWVFRELYDGAREAHRLAVQFHEEERSARLGPAITFSRTFITERE